MNGSIQLDLPVAPAQPAAAADVDWLVRIVAAHGWMTRREIVQAAGLQVTEWHLRWVRGLVEAAGPRIVKGQKGFNVPQNCTVEELKHAANQQISQGQHMVDYGVSLLRLAHKMVG
jgi:hypothetical protein